MKDHAACDRIRMLLAEVGLDPARMHCTDDVPCGVLAGVGSEGFTLEEVDRLTDKAIELARMSAS